jgi:5-methylcytosine-specific restriction endonuclease McrA
VNYDTEAWYKLYIRESTEDRLLPVLNRSLRDFLLRLAKSREDATILAKTENPGEDLARALGAHQDEHDLIVSFINSMLKDGYLRHKKGRLWITNFVNAQQARSPGAIRQQRWRENNPELQKRRAGMAQNYDLIRALRRCDGSQCCYCERTLDFRAGKGPSQATVDHVIAITRGGSDGPENLVLACRECNSRKANRSPEEAQMPIRFGHVRERLAGVSPRDVTEALRETPQKRRSDPRRGDPNREETRQTPAPTAVSRNWQERIVERERRLGEFPRPRHDPMQEPIPISQWFPSQQHLGWAKENRLSDERFDAALVAARNKLKGAYTIEFWDDKVRRFLESELEGRGPKGPNRAGGAGQPNTGAVTHEEFVR